MIERLFEDFAVGQTFGSKRMTISDQQIASFAAQIDPQPFHLDENTACDAIFHGLAASGWYTAAATMRLLVDSELRPAGGLIGAGCDELRWPRPVRPGDELRAASEVLDVRPSKSRPDHGLVKIGNFDHGANRLLRCIDEPVAREPCRGRRARASHFCLR